ncbi:uncharacterized protein LOC129592844 isoform X2 [Paramacrobiotus metropolitanus]|nr:uncharacterized protein LOC129592844 isoform X2 [Paramacrobiotus metropolitanus]
MDRKCGQTVELGCPYEKDFISSGTLRYGTFPTGNCTVHIATNISAVNCRVLPTWYMNIRKSNIPESASLHILRTNNGTDWTTAKIIPGGPSPANSYPTSVAQLKTRISSQKTQLRFLYVGDGSRHETNSSHYELEIDYTVLSDNYGTIEVWCKALGASVLSDVVCREDDRLTCPSDYYDTVNRNPATGFGACGLNSPDIFGIAIGCAFGVLFFIIFGIIWYKRKDCFLCLPKNR